MSEQMTFKSVSEDHLMAAVAANFIDRAPETFGIDLSVLIPVALEILLMLLQDCPFRPTPAQLAARLAKADRDVFTRLAIREAVRRACRNQRINVPDAVQGRIRAGIRTGFEVMGHQERHAICLAATAMAYGEGV